MITVGTVILLLIFWPALALVGAACLWLAVMAVIVALAINYPEHVCLFVGPLLLLGVYEHFKGRREQAAADEANRKWAEEHDRMCRENTGRAA